MSEIVLTGIKGDVPIGAMAAFGLFRLMSRIRLHGETHLCWAPRGAVGVQCSARTASYPKRD